MLTIDWTEVARAVVAVGAGGRGFLIEHSRGRLVVTAAHCLPEIPPPHPGRNLDEATFGKVVGPIGDEPTICAECLFLDVIADLAVLGAPDGQELWDEYAAYEAFVDGRPALALGDIPPSPCWARELHPVRVLRLDGQWADGRASHGGGCLSLDQLRVASGMSGSPIVNGDGHAVGVVSTGLINPRLAADLPCWLWAAPPPIDVPDEVLAALRTIGESQQ